MAAGTEPDPVQAPTDTTGPDAAPAAPPTEAEWATREARYRRDRLMLVDLPPDPTLPDGVSWEVVDGRGSSLSTRTLATIAQDEDLGLELDRELKRSRTASKVMFWTGVGLALLSPVPLVGVEGGAISENQDRAWSTVFLLASGGLTMSLSASPRKAARSRQQHPALYMEGDMAEDVVVVHNHRLYGSLELDQRPPPDEDAADDAAEGGAAEGAPDTAPEGDAPEGGAAEGDAAEGDAAEGDAAEGDAAEGAEAPTEGDAAGGDAAEGEMDAAEVDANEAAEAPAPPEDGSDGAPPDALEPGEPSPGTTPNAPAESQPTDGGEGAASDR